MSKMWEEVGGTESFKETENVLIKIQYDANGTGVSEGYDQVGLSLGASSGKMLCLH